MSLSYPVGDPYPFTQPAPAPTWVSVPNAYRIEVPTDKGNIVIVSPHADEANAMLEKVLKGLGIKWRAQK